MIRAIIFDCFGVVISDALEALVAPLRQKNATISDAIVQVLQTHNRGLITPEESNKQIAALLGLSYEQYRQAIDKGEVKNEELVAYIVQLREYYKVAMLSNIDGKGLRRRFKEQGLEQVFDVVVASSDIGYGKPEPEAYEIVAERLGVRLDECVFTDDREPYCEGARGVGMQAILYTNFTQFKADLEKLLADS